MNDVAGVGEPRAEGQGVRTLKAARFDPRRTRRSLFAGLVAARRRRGGKFVALVDHDGRELTYDDLLKASLALGGAIARRTRRTEKVAVLLPTGAGAAVTFFALTAYGRVPAMLNFTAGATALNAACQAAQIELVLTAKAFLDAGDLHPLADALAAEGREVVHLEDLREELSLVDKARAGVGLVAPNLVAVRSHPQSQAVVLFTSGTEGAPKGVVLTHANVLANVEQVRQHVELYDTDIIFNPLPTFHCFGLTAGLILPLMAGLKAVLHPTPLQAKNIAKRVAEHQATILFGTDTFMSQYARAGVDGDLASLRFAVCGAERVRDETRQLVSRKHGVELLEGYGVTEAAPVVAVNQPGANRPGTVGRLLPGIEARIEPVPGIADSGRLVVRGPNVMAGYITPDKPGELQTFEGGWHDTGDIVSIDEDGYVTIRGRLKRFAKIGGEMISLSVVENCASSVWPEHRHAAVSVPDRRKGEQIILITDFPNADRHDLVTWAQTHGVPELAMPRRIVTAAEVPVLGTGKTDYVAAQKIAETMVAEAQLTEPAGAA